MALSIFCDEAKPPREGDLAVALGDSYRYWKELRDHIEREYAPITVEWLFTSKNRGWGSRLKREKRAILYMTPCEGYFLASFALGEKAVKAAHDAGISPSVLAVIDNAKKYAEGRGVRLEVRSANDVFNVKKLAAVKAAN